MQEEFIHIPEFLYPGNIVTGAISNFQPMFS